MLKTKSVQLPALPEDGLRILVMRRPQENLEWDMWIPHLAPSHELLTAYHNHEFDWSGMEVRYKKEVVANPANRKYFISLITLAQEHDVTLLCWEETSEQCHRRLIIEECQRLKPDLTIQLDF